MSSWLRRVRGAAGMGLTWAAAWLPVGAVIGTVTGLAMSLPLGRVVVSYLVTFGVLGFLGGTIFSGILRLTEGRRSFDQLSPRRFAAWGALGGLMLGGLAVSIGLFGAGPTVLGLVMVGTAGVLGAASAAGSLALARAADDDEAARIRRTAAAMDLTVEELRELLSGSEARTPGHSK